MIIPAAGKGCLFFSHRLCQTQAPFAKTEQISLLDRASEKNPADSRTLKTAAIRAGQGGAAEPPATEIRASPREGEGDGKRRREVVTSLTSRPLEKEDEARVGEEEAEEKGVGAGQGPEPGRGGAGA